MLGWLPQRPIIMFPVPAGVGAIAL